MMCGKASAQFYLGGTGGFCYFSDMFQFKVLPSVGYEFNDRWAIGAGLGFLIKDDSAYVLNNYYGRFNCWNNGKLFVDAKAVTEFVFSNGGTAMNIGAVPSLRYKFTPHWQVAADVGLVGMQYDGDDWSPAFGVTANADLTIIYQF